MIAGEFACKSVGEEYEAMKAYFVDRALHGNAASIANLLANVPYEPYAPVRQQMLNILRLVNAARRKAGLEPIGSDALRYKRRIVKPFDCSNDRPSALSTADYFSPTLRTH